MDPETFRTIVGFSGGSLVATLVALAVAWYKQRREQPYLTANLRMRTFAPPTAAEQQVAFTLAGQEFDSMTIVTFTVVNKSSGDLRDIDFLLKGTEKSRLARIDTEPEEFEASLEFDKKAETNRRLLIPVLRKGDSAEVVFVFSEQPEVTQLWRGDGKVKIVGEGSASEHPTVFRFVSLVPGTMTIMACGISAALFTISPPILKNQPLQIESNIEARIQALELGQDSDLAAARKEVAVLQAKADEQARRGDELLLLVGKAQAICEAKGIKLNDEPVPK